MIFFSTQRKGDYLSVYLSGRRKKNENKKKKTNKYNEVKGKEEKQLRNKEQRINWYVFNSWPATIQIKKK